MERLTRSSAINATLKSDTEKNEFDCVCRGCRKFEKCTAENKTCNLFLAIEKLAAYEDTGLEPEEIIDGKMLTGWIPVSEKLPEHLNVVLVTTHDEDIQLAFYDCEGWHLSSNKWVFVSSPLAWMPLPEPYKQN